MLHRQTNKEKEMWQQRQRARVTERSVGWSVEPNLCLRHKFFSLPKRRAGPITGQCSFVYNSLCRHALLCVSVYSTCRRRPALYPPSDLWAGRSAE